LLYYQCMKDSIGNSFSDLTVSNLIDLGQSDNIDDNELASRLVKRIVLEGRHILSTVEQEDLFNLQFVTDHSLFHLAAWQSKQDAGFCEHCHELENAGKGGAA
jgi:hypothetical protein